MFQNCLSGKCVTELLSFQKLIAPAVVHVLYWIALVAVVGGGLRVMLRKEFVPGVLLIILGPIAVRTVTEILLIPFLIHARIEEMQGVQAANAGSTPASRRR